MCSFARPRLRPADPREHDGGRPRSGRQHQAPLHRVAGTGGGEEYGGKECCSDTLLAAVSVS